MLPSESLQIDLSVILDEVAAFLASGPTPEQIVAFRLSEASEAAISGLLEANRTRGLTVDERQFLDEYTRIERLMQAVKVRALTKLKAITE